MTMTLLLAVLNAVSAYVRPDLLHFQRPGG